MPPTFLLADLFTRAEATRVSRSARPDGPVEIRAPRRPFGLLRRRSGGT
jgi:hypothetical protein